MRGRMHCVSRPANRNLAVIKTSAEQSISYGTNCAGVSWYPSSEGAPDPQCFIRPTMDSYVKYPNYLVYSARRIDPASLVQNEADVPAAMKPVCNDDNGASYTARDGSQYQIVCQQDFGGNDMGVVVTDSLVSCVNICSAWGSECKGVTWVPSGQEEQFCWIKSTMVNSVYPIGLTCHSAPLLYSAARVAPRKIDCWDFSKQEWQAAVSLSILVRHKPAN